MIEDVGLHLDRVTRTWREERLCNAGVFGRVRLLRLCLCASATANGSGPQRWEVRLGGSRPWREPRYRL